MPWTACRWPGNDTGLTGIADRLGAVGGTAEITAALGASVRVEGRLPLTAEAAALQAQ